MIGRTLAVIVLLCGSTLQAAAQAPPPEVKPPDVPGESLERTAEEICRLKCLRLKLPSSRKNFIVPGEDGDHFFLVGNSTVRRLTWPGLEQERSVQLGGEPVAVYQAGKGLLIAISHEGLRGFTHVWMDQDLAVTSKAELSWNSPAVACTSTTAYFNASGALSALSLKDLRKPKALPGQSLTLHYPPGYSEKIGEESVSWQRVAASQDDAVLVLWSKHLICRGTRNKHEVQIRHVSNHYGSIQEVKISASGKYVSQGTISPGDAQLFGPDSLREPLLELPSVEVLAMAPERGRLFARYRSDDRFQVLDDLGRPLLDEFPTSSLELVVPMGDGNGALLLFSTSVIAIREVP